MNSCESGRNFSSRDIFPEKREDSLVVGFATNIIRKLVEKEIEPETRREDLLFLGKMMLFRCKETEIAKIRGASPEHGKIVAEAMALFEEHCRRVIEEAINLKEEAKKEIKEIIFGKPQLVLEVLSRKVF